MVERKNYHRVRFERSYDDSSIASPSPELNVISPCIDDHVESNLGEKPVLELNGKSSDSMNKPSHQRTAPFSGSPSIPETNVLLIKGESFEPYMTIALLLQAAAYGLPIVAAKNGGPIDIHRVLDNGLLVDPHDQQSIADTLLKLVVYRHIFYDRHTFMRLIANYFRVKFFG
ncbi:hypothetical protein CRYUN_Cryun14cG0076100 [Craigia yunnanensis]